jgi:UDP-N-acetylmuramoyl-tripeptide--D-alanyl-D-alanine ligase
MIPMPLSRIAEWTGGHLAGAGGRDVLIDSVSIDSRTLDAGDGRGTLFVALAGDRCDGHDHVVAAAEQGARAALVSRTVDAALPQLVVADTERALAAMAAAMQHVRHGRVVAVTGSNGKTTVKQLALAILGQAGHAYANPGNRNNEIGLPLAVIDAPDDADFLIYEMGAGKPGDIAYLTTIARPHVSLVNNIGSAHLERMGSLEGIADTKGAIYDALPADGVAVVNADDAFAAVFERRIRERHPKRSIIRFGIVEDADVRARSIVSREDGSDFVLSTPQGDIAVSLPLAGRHNVANALAAASLALGCGVGLEAISAGLRGAVPVSGRLVRHRMADGSWLIDDSYNANPDSLSAAIDTLAAMSGESWLVLGDMRELGDGAEALHAEAGRHARAAGIARLYALGPLSAHAAREFGEGGHAFDSHAELADALRRDMHTLVRVLVKGSRGSAMDRVVSALLAPRNGSDADVA